MSSTEAVCNDVSFAGNVMITPVMLLELEVSSIVECNFVERKALRHPSTAEKGDGRDAIGSDANGEGWRIR